MRRAELTLRREDGRVVCESVRVADTTLRRLRGLLGRKSLPPDQGMLLRPAWSIHTWFMRFPIDVVFLDPDQVVVKIEHEVRPFKTATCRGAREVVELSSGECARRGLELGDRVSWAARSTADPLGDDGGTLTASPSHWGERAGDVLVVSADPRFTRLVRFLLEGRELAVTVAAPDRAAAAAASTDPAAVVVDASSGVADALRLAAAVGVETGAPVVLACEEAGLDVPGGTPAFHKWDETELLVAEVERLAQDAHEGTG